MPSVLIDMDIEGQAEQIWLRMHSADWREFTANLEVTFLRFRDVGLDPSSTDKFVWHFCQAHNYYLLTSNRNEESEDSLQATICRESRPHHLPVFTLPLADRVYQSTAFLERVVEKLFDFLIYADNIRGAGRLYLP